MKDQTEGVVWHCFSGVSLYVAKETKRDKRKMLIVVQMKESEMNEGG